MCTIIVLLENATPNSKGLVVRVAAYIYGLPIRFVRLNSQILIIGEKNTLVSECYFTSCSEGS